MDSVVENSVVNLRPKDCVVVKQNSHGLINLNVLFTARSRVLSSTGLQSKLSYSSATSEPDCPELPSKPSWSLSSIMERRDAFNNTPDRNKDITPEVIDHLLNLAHLSKPQDPQELKRLERDVRRMRNFLEYIQSPDVQNHGAALVESLRSLVDDGEGLRLRPSPVMPSDPAALTEEEKEAVRRRDTLLERPKRTKGNFFVIGAELDPKQDN
ncbi:hypothetical protein BGX26_010602 [Mortierella sp. AD094]|nr:hypothetical protein BGX26_010602 [Mortierella sp. AD094]